METRSKEIQFGSLLSSSVSSVLTFIVFFIIMLQIFQRGKRKGKNWNPKWNGLPGLEVFKKVPSFIPLKLVGALPHLYPVKSSLEKVKEWGRTYGDVFTGDALGETILVLNCGPLAQQMLKSTEPGHLTKSPMIYGLMKPFLVNGLLVSKGELWQCQRKLLQKSQSYQTLKSYLPMLNKHCKKFVKELEEMFKDGRAHEINGLINVLFIKVICEMITEHNDDESEEYEDYHHNFQIWKESFIKRILYPWLLIKPIWWLHSISKKHDKAVDEMFDFARRRIREKRAARAETEKPMKIQSILDDLLDAGVDERQIIDEFNTIIFGGHETGASVIHCFLFYMALYPEVQEKCQKEIDELFNEELTFDLVNSSLKYVERCILETLRLLPPPFAFFRKLESPIVLKHEDQQVLVPAGTNVAIIPYILHRKEEYFPDPEKFDPDRWLPEEMAKRHAYSFLAFSGGQRNCLGMKFAMIEMKMIVAYTLRRFKITTTDKMEDIPMLPYLTLTPAKDFSFKFTKRELKP